MKHIQISRQLNKSRFEVLFDGCFDSIPVEYPNEMIFDKIKSEVIIAHKALKEAGDKLLPSDVGIGIIRLLDDDAVVESVTTYEAMAIMISHETIAFINALINNE